MLNNKTRSIYCYDQILRELGQVTNNDAGPVPDSIKKEFDGLGLDGFKPMYAVQWPHIKSTKYDILKTSDLI